ncbi:MAG TPA: alpha/beta fold hydrolase [Candidatus Obscuribacterales bacterium]
MLLQIRHGPKVGPEHHAQPDDGRHDIVLLHGMGANGDLWKPQVVFLEQLGHRCFVIDLRGHGITDEPGHEADLDTHIDDVIETIEKISVRLPAVFIGHSLGALILLHMAQKRPDAVHKIFAVGAPMRVLPPIKNGFELLLKHIHPNLKDTWLHPLLPWRQRTLLSTPEHTLKQIVNSVADIDLVSAPLKLSCTVHFAAGRLDPIAPCMYLEQVHKMLPNSTLDIWEWGGHSFFMGSREQSFNTWLSKYLSAAHDRLSAAHDGLSAAHDGLSEREIANTTTA